jgi:hypothetical protein
VTTETLSGQEIQRNLRAFVRTWTNYRGSERAEAQTFVNELFACYGTDRRAAGAHMLAAGQQPTCAERVRA